MGRLKTFWAEFRAFAFQGNMIELAVAVVIGGAFSNVIHAVVSDIINPSITYAVTAVQATQEKAAEAAQVATSKVGLLPTTHPATQSTTAAATATAPVVAATPPAAAPAPAPAAPATTNNEPTKAVQFQWMLGRYPIGDFIGELINFLIIAFAIFVLIVKVLGGMVKRVGGTPEPGEPATKECPECLSVIPAKARRCAHCTAVLIPAGA